ncbi:hypothetical protein CPLU01_01315 [Colletotrichum plurivorum]|uniref:Uncharacterized protein n=1 Tax=Colletotrichum plurivorum TaxID=2175906 RepID=A0A8H6U4S0_9PEZI|nr:hypothetical protein CPLU01_01315 [Colletotrichum plurivorum]
MPALRAAVPIVGPLDPPELLQRLTEWRSVEENESNPPIGVLEPSGFWTVPISDYSGLVAQRNEAVLHLRKRPLESELHQHHIAERLVPLSPNVNGLLIVPPPAASLGGGIQALRLLLAGSALLPNQPALLKSDRRSEIGLGSRRPPARGQFGILRFRGKRETEDFLKSLSRRAGRPNTKVDHDNDEDRYVLTA